MNLTRELLKELFIVIVTKARFKEGSSSLARIHHVKGFVDNTITFNPKPTENFINVEKVVINIKIHGRIEI